MERRMRRFRQQLPEGEAWRVLRDCSNGILSLVDIDGEPYGVPLSYACDDEGHIYFHSAVAGHKIECIRHSGRCSFCVVERDDVVAEEFTTYFRSVIVSGKVSIVTAPEETERALRLLSAKYSPGIDPTAEIAKGMGHVVALRLDISRITGKQAIELTRADG